MQNILQNTKGPSNMKQLKSKEGKVMQTWACWIMPTSPRIMPNGHTNQVGLSRPEIV